MSNILIEVPKSLSIMIDAITTEDFYNHLYWDHRIYDIRPKEEYISSHVYHAHSMNPSPNITVDDLADIDAQIDNDYGKAEHPWEVLIYTKGKNCYNDENHPHSRILSALLSYLSSDRNLSNKSLKQIYILIDGFESFQSKFPFLCSANVYFQECNLLVWPSYIIPNLFLGSSMCRNETVLSMLKITHIMSFSDYPEKQVVSTNIKTLHWEISDSLSTKLSSVFPSALDWLSKAIHDNKGIVLIHCDQGVSRSASVVIAYLLKYDVEFPTMDAALTYVKSKRNVIRPNVSFLQQLEEYSSTINIQNKYM